MLKPKIGDLVVLPQNSDGILALGVVIAEGDKYPEYLVYWVDDDIPTWEPEGGVARCIDRGLRSVSSTG